MPWRKDPQAVLDYTFDWADWLPSGDTISSVAWEVSPGVTIASVSNTTTTATIWLSGGTEGQKASVRCRITTAAGRVEDATEVLHLRQK